MLARRYSQHPQGDPASETNVDEIGTSTTPWQYDLAGNLVSIPGMINDARYKANGDTVWITYANATRTDFTYNGEREWLSSVLTTGPSGSLQDVAYSRGPTGRIDAINGTTTGLKDHWAFIYDDLDQLLTADNLDDNALDQDFQYDDLGNMIWNSKVGTYAYPLSGPGVVRPHAQTQIDLAGTIRAFTYDANGNITGEGGVRKTRTSL